MIKVSVIIPIYKAEKYILRCIHSLFDQTLDEIEFIFVDDCSPDKSIQILNQAIEQYPERKNHVKIIRLNKNSKQAAARQVGLDNATGMYVIHCDPDDWVDLDFYETLFLAAIQSDLDIVTSEYVEVDSCNNVISKCTPIITEYPMEALYSASFYSMSLCNHLIKRSIASKVHFYNNINYMEDYGFLTRVLFLSKKIGHVHNTYYYYNKANISSITSQQNEPYIIRQRIDCLNLTDTFFEKYGIHKKKLLLSLRLKRDIKNIYLNSESLKKWQELFPEVAMWEFKNSTGSFLYRLAYLLSHKVGTWPMKILLKSKGL